MRPETHPAIPASRAGVLLINLGTPDAPTPQAIRRYLREFLADRRVVELPRLLWLPILYGFILPFRPKRLAHAYGAIWQADGSPLMSASQQLAQALGTALRAETGAAVPVALGMRYGQPSVATAIDALLEQGARRILALPLYPQYSATTTASAMDAVYAHAQTLRWMPELRSIQQYHDHGGYIAALADSVRRHWQAQGRGQRLLISFHGIPQRYFEAGDPYHCHCQKTARLVAQALQLGNEDYAVAFQSRFGKAPWLQPYADVVLRQWGASGLKQVDVICPGFAADCLETLEEISIRYREEFIRAGGGELRYIAALNAAPAHAQALAQLCAQHLQGWLAQGPDAATAN